MMTIKHTPLRHTLFLLALGWSLLAALTTHAQTQPRGCGSEADEHDPRWEAGRQAFREWMDRFQPTTSAHKTANSHRLPLRNSHRGARGV